MAHNLGFTATPRDPNTVDLTDYFGGFITPGFTPPPDQVSTPAVMPPQPPPAAPTFGQWLNANSQLVLMGGAAVLILAIVAGGRRR